MDVITGARTVTASESGVDLIPRVALRMDEAAAALGLSRDAFDDHVKPELRLIRRGRLVLVPVAELEAWAERSAEATLP
jgi:excisionase family DNA binding protein